MLFNLSHTEDLAKFNTKTSLLKSKGATVQMTEKKGSRTLQQNKAIHLYCEMVADTLNELGWTFRFEGLKNTEMELKYTMSIVKETIWRPIQIALFEKESTTELSTMEVSVIAEQIEHFFVTKQGIDLPFPSIENLEIKTA